ncbi:MAG: universal stress protein [Chloroflexi bacterium]|jgi:nucleotide-binding universal stress UspA family protein|nr:universal stress protein [Chloroflexota bacterium]
MFKRIMVPLDGSALAEQVLPAVTELARAFGSEVAVVGICGAEDRDENEACVLYTGRKGDDIRGMLSGSKATVKTIVIPGSAAEQILSYARTEAVGLIFLCSHGRSGIMRWSLGSTVDKVLRKAETALIIVRAMEPPSAGHLFSRILVPLDGSESSVAVLPQVAEAACRLNSQVLLMRVIEPGVRIRTIGGLDYVPFRERDAAAARTEMMRYLDNQADELSRAAAMVSCEVRQGDAAREILALADERGCTLIAMSSHGHSRIRRWSMGSVTSKIVQASSQSIWLVPSFFKE